MPISFTYQIKPFPNKIFYQLDWTKKENARAAIRLAVKKELRGIVPFSERDKILKEIIEQAEGQYSEWPMVG